MIGSWPEFAARMFIAAPVHIPVDVWRKYWPVILGAIGVMIVLILIRGNGKGRTTTPGNPAQGGGSWRRIPISGEMLTGRAHHVIYFASIRFPDWAEGRREEIIARIKSAFPEPDYEYDER